MTTEITTVLETTTSTPAGEVEAVTLAAATATITMTGEAVKVKDAYVPGRWAPHLTIEKVN